MPKLADLSVEFISLVKRPANGRRVILRGADSRGREFPIAKADAKLHRVYGVVYAPDSVDAQGDWTDAETIRKAADRWMQEGRAPYVDQEHQFQPVPAFVAESWLVRKGDPLFPDEKEGAWAVGIQVLDAALWDAIEAGEVEGLSLAGTARLEKRHGFISRLFNREKETDMTPDEVRAIVKEAIAETVRRAEDESEREKLIKTAEAAAAEAATAKAELAKTAEALKEALSRIEALEKAVKDKAAGSPEGEAKPQDAAASFV